MKKIVSMFLCLSVLALAGCAEPEQAENGGEPPPAETRDENPSENLPQTETRGEHPDEKPPQEEPRGDEPHDAGGVWAIEEVAPRELEPGGQMRGNIALFMRIDIGAVELPAGAVARFDLTSSQEDATLRFLLTNTETEEVVEGSVTGSGGVTLEIVTAGKYILTLENLSELDVYFTIDYDFGGTSI